MHLNSQRALHIGVVSIRRLGTLVCKIMYANGISYFGTYLATGIFMHYHILTGVTYCYTFQLMLIFTLVLIFLIIKLSSVDSIEDADVFCFLTNFQNPNSVNFNEIDNSQFDVLYLIIKIANSLAKRKPVVVVEEEKFFKKNLYVEKIKPRRPIIMADGVVTMNILRYLTRDSLPNDIFFCPTPLPTIAKSILGEKLKVNNKVHTTSTTWQNT